MSKQPKFDRPGATSYKFSGFFDDYLKAVTDNWLTKIVKRNPGILRMFADRDKKPYQELLSWSGEFAGKYITGAVQILRLTGDQRLKDYIGEFVNQLLKYQAEDGYLGPWPKEYQLTGTGPNVVPDEGAWETWNHYHMMLGLMLWSQEIGDDRAFQAAKKIGDLMCERFLGKRKSILNIGLPEKNGAILHSVCLLYRQTQDEKYLALAKQIVENDLKSENLGDPFKNAVEGKPFYLMGRSRWETLHMILGFIELYWITGEEDYRKAFENIWWSIAEYDRHNTGAFASHERAIGSPYHLGSIETCCSVAWSAMSIEMLKLTGSSIVADELELTLLNAIVGYKLPAGRLCTYHTPMDGVRESALKAISFQAKPGTEELSCCSTNFPRGFGLVSDWALMQNDNGLILNWYGPSEMTAQVKDTTITLKQTTEYPRCGSVTLEVCPDKPIDFALKLRIPHWSKTNKVAVNGDPISGVKPGEYLELKRKWQQGDKVNIELDMSLHYWAGEKEYDGKTSIYRGPILLAYNSKLVPAKIKYDNNWQMQGVLHRSKTKGAKAEFDFVGDRIVLVAFTFDDGGMASVKIDGKEVAIVDQYVDGEGLPFFWDYKGAGPGKHKIEVTVIDDKNPASKGNFVSVKTFLEWGHIPAFDAKNMKICLAEKSDDPDKIISLQATDIDGNKIELCDFGTVAKENESYISWLNVINAPKTDFSKSNPLRSCHVDQQPSVYAGPGMIDADSMTW